MAMNGQALTLKSSSVPKSKKKSQTSGRIQKQTPRKGQVQQVLAGLEKKDQELLLALFHGTLQSNRENVWHKTPEAHCPTLLQSVGAFQFLPQTHYPHHRWCLSLCSGSTGDPQKRPGGSSPSHATMALAVDISPPSDWVERLEMAVAG